MMAFLPMGLRVPATLFWGKLALSEKKKKKSNRFLATACYNNFTEKKKNQSSSYCFFLFVWGRKLSRSNVGTWVTQFHFTVRNKDT